MKILKKHLLAAAVVSSSAFMSPIAMSDTSDKGFYLTAGIGTGLETDVDGSVDGTDFTAKGHTTFVGRIGLGYDFDNSWRVEAGFTRGTANIDELVVDGTTYNVGDNGSATGALISVAYDFENYSKITSYISGSYAIA